jgi:pilus assembly protein FimV
MSQKQRLTLAMALALGSSQALALGLGNIEIRSGLNEPLVAEIPVVSASAAELEALRVRLAPPEAFARVGANRPAIMAANLEFAVGRDDQGRPVIRVTTPGKVRDPYLNFLLEVEWQRGRLLREYTVLLDPPMTSARRVAPVRAPAAEVEAPVRATPEPATAPTPAPEPTTPPATPPRAEPSPAQPAAPSTPREPARQPAPAAQVADGRFGPVREGQTLWAVAQQVRPQGVDTNQAMIALLAANPEAFIGGNINRLRSGAVLRIPSADEFAVFSAQDAAFQVRQQAEDWQATVRQPVSAAGVERPAGGRTATRDSRLELVPPGGDTPASASQSGVAANAQGRELRADLDRAREQVSTLQQENRELQSRVSDLEQLDSDARSLIQLKDSQLADAQRRLAELEAEREAARRSAAAAPAIPPVSDEPPAIDLDDVDQEPIVDRQAEPAIDDDADLGAADELASPVDQAVVAPPPAAERPAAQRPAAERPAAERPAPAPARPLYLNPFVIGGAVLALLGLLVAVLRRRRQPEEPRRGGVAAAYAEATAGAAARAETGDEQERELLDAVAEQPDDLGRHLALVTHYYENGDASGFEGAAEAMYAQLYDPEDMAWKQVVAMGRELLPDHPLFAVTEADRADFAASLDAADDGSDIDFGADRPGDQKAGLPAAGATNEVDWGMAPTAAGDTRQYSVDELDQIAREQNEVADQVADERAEQQRAEQPQDADDAGYDLDFDRSGDGGEPAMDEAADGDDSFGEAGADGDDAAATKLELARAYLDMGDVEGARGMLEEVVGEGNAGQRSEAKRLLDEIR